MCLGEENLTLPFPRPVHGERLLNEICQSIKFNGAPYVIQVCVIVINNHFSSLCVGYEQIILNMWCKYWVGQEFMNTGTPFMAGRKTRLIKHFSSTPDQAQFRIINNKSGITPGDYLRLVYGALELNVEKIEHERTSTT